MTGDEMETKIEELEEKLDHLQRDYDDLKREKDSLEEDCISNDDYEDLKSDKESIEDEKFDIEFQLDKCYLKPENIKDESKAEFVAEELFDNYTEDQLREMKRIYDQFMMQNEILNEELNKYND